MATTDLRLPAIAELDALPEAAFSDALALLFEGSPRFVMRLAGCRPFGTDEALLACARSVALGMPREERIELLNSHPRIGADPRAVSALSYREQGYGHDSAVGQAELRRIQADLDRLNAEYERRFGFRCVVHVAGRSRAEIVPVLEDRLGADPDEELRRGLGDVIAIAGDRLERLREETER